MERRGVVEELDRSVDYVSGMTLVELDDRMRIVKVVAIVDIVIRDRCGRENSKVGRARLAEALRCVESIYKN